MVSIDEITKSILDAYGSLETPDYSFLEKKYKRNPHKGLLGELRKAYGIENLTDFNNDVSCVYVLTKESKWILYLSLVADYFLLLGVNNDNSLFTVDLPDYHEAKEILATIHDYGFIQISNTLLFESIPFKRINSRDDSSKLFQVIFSDVEALF